MSLGRAAEIHAGDLFDEYLGSLLAFPDEARASLVSPSWALSLTQQAAYALVRSTVAKGFTPTQDAIMFVHEGSNEDLSPLLSYLDAKGPRSPRKLLPRLAKAHVALNLQNAITGLQEDIDAQRIDAARKKLERAIAASVGGDAKASNLRDLVAAAVETIALNDAGVRFGWERLDSVLRAYPGDVMVVGADTGIGKSSAVTTWLLNMAKAKTPVCYISCEDDDRVLGARLVSQLGGVEQCKWRLGRWSQADFASMQAVDYDLPWNSYFLPKGEIDEVVRCIFSAAYSGAKVVAVDYFQALAIGGRFGGDVERYNEILNRLVVAAKQANVVLILASQVRRAPPSAAKAKSHTAEPAEPREPSVNDLFGTGHLERRAQIIVMLWGDRAGKIHGRLAKAKSAGAGLKLDLYRDEVTGAVNETVAPPWGYS